MEVPPWNIEAIGNCMALELWRLISQTGTDLAVSITEINHGLLLKFICYLFNVVVVIDDSVVEGKCNSTDIDGLWQWP